MSTEPLLQVDLSLLPPSIPSLYIHRAFANTDVGTVERIFRRLQLGELESVCTKPLYNKKEKEVDKHFKSFHIKLKYWNSNADCDDVRRTLLSGKEVHVFFTDTHFWKVAGLRFYDEAVPKYQLYDRRKAGLNSEGFDVEKVEKPSPKSSKEKDPPLQQERAEEEDKKPGLEPSAPPSLPTIHCPIPIRHAPPNLKGDDFRASLQGLSLSPPSPRSAFTENLQIQELAFGLKTPPGYTNYGKCGGFHR